MSEETERFMKEHPAAAEELMCRLEGIVRKQPWEQIARSVREAQRCAEAPRDRIVCPDADGEERAMLDQLEERGWGTLVNALLNEELLSRPEVFARIVQRIGCPARIRREVRKLQDIWMRYIIFRDQMMSCLNAGHSEAVLRELALGGEKVHSDMREQRGKIWQQLLYAGERQE